ncbi:GtrA family protein [Vibrio jasicida]|uniref:GtrA family protein n=1 Tax=Vibrio jasicida TaxID=766224 RepID=UPI0005ED90DA|nr:GtrA family protein [Vibrio jasicida]
MHKSIRFALVGGVGFIVDTLIFSLLFHWLGLELMLARWIAFLFAATTTWLGNRWLTFSQAEKTDPFAQWQKFMVSACISAVPNFAAFKGLTLMFGTQNYMVYIALVFGILVGMMSNYLLSTKWVFSKH